MSLFTLLESTLEVPTFEKEISTTTLVEGGKGSQRNTRI